MTKYDLKDGMVVENREGRRYLIIGDKLMGAETFCELDELNVNLTNVRYKQLDIMRVYETKDCTISTIFRDDRLTPIWTRKEVIEVGSIVKVIRSGGRYTTYVGFFKNNNIDRCICARYRYNDCDTFKDSDRFRVLQIIDDYVIIERQSFTNSVYLFALDALEVVE